MTRQSPDALQVLLDKQAITEVLHRYCFAMDQNDRALGKSVWHPDGTAHYVDMFEGSGHDFVEFGQGGHEAAFNGTSHQVTNIMIEVDGERATSATYVTAACRIKDTENVYQIRGRYLDTWSRRDGEWKIDARRFETDLWQVVPSNHELIVGASG
jgi:hypothetical protein